MNKNNNKIIKCLYVAICIILSAIILTSCEKKELEIQQDFPFEVTTMPVRPEISKGQTVQIRVNIKSSGSYEGTKYFIRYFQFEGEGMLRYERAMAYTPNDPYPLPAKQFSLYYTSKSDQGQAFSVWISDSFGNEKQLDFEFSNKNTDENTELPYTVPYRDDLKWLVYPFVY